MPEQSHPMDHVDRRQIVLHEIRSSKVQNVQIVDGVQFFLRRMQPGDWSGAFRYMRAVAAQVHRVAQAPKRDRKSTRLNSSHGYISYAVFCLKKKKKTQ